MIMSGAMTCTGTIPVKWGDFDLQILDLSLNELTGSLPDMLGSTSNISASLMLLDVSNNNMSGKCHIYS